MLGPVLSQSQKLGIQNPFALPFYIPLILMSHATTFVINTSPHITMQCSSDVMLCFGGNPCTCVQPCEQKFLTQSMFASVTMLDHLYGVRDSNPRCNPWHIYLFLPLSFDLSTACSLDCLCCVEHFPIIDISLLLCNILLPVNCYNCSITINMIGLPMVISSEL